jgi:hypothetical protein
MAIEDWGGDVTGVIFHHDRCNPYVSRNLGQLCARNGVGLSHGLVSR